jgi:hypothetical protein
MGKKKDKLRVKVWYQIGPTVNVDEYVCTGVNDSTGPHSTVVTLKGSSTQRIKYARMWKLEVTRG